MEPPKLSGSFWILEYLLVPPKEEPPKTLKQEAEEKRQNHGEDAF